MNKEINERCIKELTYLNITTTKYLMKIDELQKMNKILIKNVLI